VCIIPALSLNLEFLASSAPMLAFEGARGDPGGLLAAEQAATETLG